MKWELYNILYIMGIVELYLVQGEKVEENNEQMQWILHTRKKGSSSKASNPVGYFHIFSIYFFFSFHKFILYILSNSSILIFLFSQVW